MSSSFETEAEYNAYMDAETVKALEELVSGKAKLIPHEEVEKELEIQRKKLLIEYYNRK